MVVGLRPYLFEIVSRPTEKNVVKINPASTASEVRMTCLYVFVHQTCALKDNKQDVTHMFSVKSSITTRPIHPGVPTAENDFKSPSTEVTEESRTIQPACIC